MTEKNRTLAQRFADLKRKTGGNREKTGFEFTFGLTPEESVRVTPLPSFMVRIFSEIHFAMEGARVEHWDEGPVDAALSILERAMEEDGTLTRRICLEAEDALMPLQEKARSFSLIYTSHAHIDMNWLWGMPETVAATLSTFRSVLHMMEEYPEFTFMQSQASVYRIVEEFDPALMDPIRQRIREGRWEVTANAWVETDKNMPGTESLLHHVKVTRAYLRHVWGVDTDRVKVDFSPDTFGHSTMIPEINRFADVPYYYHCRGTREDLVLFRFRAPSGAEVLAYKEPYWYNSGVNPDNGIGLPALSEMCAGLKTGLIVYGVGNHGGGPTRRDIERILDMRTWPVFPAIRFGRLHDFFAAAESVRSLLPVVDHELNPIFQGCYTTQSRIKNANRRGEVSLGDASAMCALGSAVAGAEYPAGRFRQAWQDLLFTHFHDILTGSCVRESREHALGLLAHAMSFTQTAEGNALRVIAEQVDTSMFERDEEIRESQSEGAGVGAGMEYGRVYSMNGEPRRYAGVPNPERGAGRTRVYTVFNTAREDRTEAVEMTLWDYTGDFTRLEALDPEGNPLELQLVDTERKKYWDHTYIRVLVRMTVPALGYATAAVREKAMDHYPVHRLNDVRVDMPLGDLVMDNGLIRAQFDPHTGDLISLVELESGEECLKGRGRLCLVETERATSDAWHIGRYLHLLPMERMERCCLKKGNLRQELQLVQKTGGSKVVSHITMDADSRDLQYEFQIEWDEKAGEQGNVPLLTYRLEVAGEVGSMLCDVPGGIVSRQESAGDQACQTFAGVRQDHGILAMCADSRYGYRLDHGVLSCSLIHSACNPDPDPERGDHHIRLALHLGRDLTGVRTHAEALMRPLVAMPVRPGKGTLPPSLRLMETKAGSSIVSGVDMPEEGVIAVRLFECLGEEDRITLRFPFPLKEAFRTDLKGRVLETLPVQEGETCFSLSPYSLTEIRLVPGNT